MDDNAAFLFIKNLLDGGKSIQIDLLISFITYAPVLEANIMNAYARIMRQRPFCANIVKRVKLTYAIDDEFDALEAQPSDI